MNSNLVDALGRQQSESGPDQVKQSTSQRKSQTFTNDFKKNNSISLGHPAKPIQYYKVKKKKQKNIKIIAATVIK